MSAVVLSWASGRKQEAEQFTQYCHVWSRTQASPCAICGQPSGTVTVYTLLPCLESKPGQSVCDLWSAKWHCDSFCPYTWFPLSISFHQCYVLTLFSMLLLYKDKRAKLQNVGTKLCCFGHREALDKQYCLQQCTANFGQVYRRHSFEKRVEFCFCIVYCNTPSDVFRDGT